MNQELKPVSFAGGHPEEDQLLLALEHELPVEDAARVEQHLGNCWSCRARYDEMQRGILAFVEYREKRYLPFVPEPLDDSSGFRDQLRKLVGERSPVGWPKRIWRRLAELISLPKHMRWVSAVAAAMVAVIFWAYVLVSPRAVSASELLVRAVEAQNPPAVGKGSTRRRVVHQKVQIRTGEQTVVRDFQWTLGSPIERARWDAQPNPLAWNAPLTAEGFAGWRDSLPEKNDIVKREGNLLTLDTTTNRNLIKTARIVVRADDFHPLEQHLRFADDQQLDFTEIAFQIVDEPQQTTRQAPEQSLGTPQKSPAPDAVSAPPNLDEAELELRYTLFVNGWDLDEDLVIGRASGQVTLAGIVSSRQREENMLAALSKLPNVRFPVDRPSSIENRGSAATRAIPAQDRAPLLMEILEKAFPARDARLTFVDRCLADSDTALSHAWALKRLVDRYDQAQEQLLKPESDRKLHEMLRSHLQLLRRSNDALAPLLDVLPAAKGADPAISSDWRSRILTLFSAVQHQDHLVSSLAAGAQTDGQNLATVSADFRVTHQIVNALLDALKDLKGDPAVK